MKNKIKYIITILILLLISLIIYFYYFRWTTYISELCGYEFKYPRNWKIEDEYIKENGTFNKKTCRVKVVSRKVVSGGYHTFGQVSVDFRDEKDNETFYQQHVDGRKKTYPAIENITINGASGIKGYKYEDLRGNGEQNFISEVFNVQNGQGVVLIDASLMDVNNGSYKETVDSIILSFQLSK